MAWEPSTGDTGGDLQIVMLPTRSDDTWSGFLIFNDNDCLGADFMKAPRQRFHGPDGSVMDTGEGAPIVLEGERLAEGHSWRRRRCGHSFTETRFLTIQARRHRRAGVRGRCTEVKTATEHRLVPKMSDSRRKRIQAAQRKASNALRRAAKAVKRTRKTGARGPLA